MSNNLTPDDLAKQSKAEEAAQPEVQEEGQGEAQEEQVQISEEEAQRALAVLQQEQNLVMGAVYGLIAAVVGAAVWAGITIATEYQIGWMAVGVGFLVGIAVRAGGKGIDQVYGVVGAFMSLVGCALGNVITIAWFVGKELGIPVSEVFAELDFTAIYEMMAATFQAIDLLFYALALYFGYRYAFRQLTMDDFNRALGRAM